MDNALIEQVERMIQEYESTSLSRSAILQSVNLSRSRELLEYAHYAATYAARIGDIELVKRGVLALAIENTTLDYRDTIARLSLLHHSAIKLGADPDRLFQEAAKISPPRFASSLERFMKRSLENRAISTFGYQEEYSPLLSYVWAPTYRIELPLRFRIKRILKKLIPFL